jgi:two-component system, sensor histidine kinase and response regulator
MHDHLQLLFTNGLLPHGHCFLWNPSLLWLHGLSDGLITLAYYAISFQLLYLMRRGRSLRFRLIYGLFGAFVFACGTTHLLDVWTLWNPDYWLSGEVKALTAIISIVAALVLSSVIPAALHMPTRAELAKINLDLAAARDAAVASGADLERALSEARAIAGARDVAVATAEQLAAARDAALEGDRLKSEFLANMSHEIRTPLNGIIGMCELLRDSHLTGDQAECAELIGNSADSLLTIINDILDFSKISAGKLVFEEIDFEPTPTIEAVVHMLGERAAQKNLELILAIDPAIPAFVRGDPNRLRQVLTNLLGNAIKFTDQGEVVFSVSLVRASGREVTLRFSITDTGIGISAEALRGLFQPFHQADGSTTRKYGGTGLGLAISAQLVGGMGGKIEVESEPGRGSSFSFSAAFRSANSNTARFAKSKILSGLRVLVVDDNQTNRHIVERQIANWGISSASVANGTEALAALRETGNHSPFDVAILDLAMPGMDGLMLAQLIKTDPAIAATRLLMMSSIGNRGEAGASAAPIEAWLTKPVKQSQLYDSLAALISTDLAKVAHPATSPPSEDPRREIRGRFRVLVAEDNPVNQTVAGHQLRKLGYAFDIAASGKHALELLAGGNYGLVLMDCMMPEMDGFAATAELRRHEAGTGRHTVVVAMTANAMEGDRDKCLAAGMDDYLGKPVQLEELTATLDHWLLGAERSSSDEEIRPLVTVRF